MNRYIDADKLQKDGWKLERRKKSLTVDEHEVMELDAVPTADVRENIKGHWVVDRYCSVCDFDKYEADCCCGGLPQNFCPNCGADMRDEEND